MDPADVASQDGARRQVGRRIEYCIERDFLGLKVILATENLYEKTLLNRSCGCAKPISEIKRVISRSFSR